FRNSPNAYASAGMDTLAEAFVGFLLGNSIGFLLAVLMSYSRTAQRTIAPYAVALKATPIIAMSPLIVAWFGMGFWSKAICGTIVAAVIGICFFGIIHIAQVLLVRWEPETV